MSAKAPLGRPSRKTGSDEAVCTSAMRLGEVVREVISNAAATSFIHTQMFEAIHTSQSMRKVGRRNGAHADLRSTSGTSGAGRFSLMRDSIISHAPPHGDDPCVALSSPHAHRALLVDQLGDRPRDRGPRLAARVYFHPLRPVG